MDRFSDRCIEAVDRICQSASPTVLETARGFHYYLGDRLKALGFHVTREARCDYLYRATNGRWCFRKGRIDLVIGGAEPTAIEIDRRSPRQKSIWKLMMFCGTRIIVIRDPKEVRSWPYLQDIALIEVEPEE